MSTALVFDIGGTNFRVGTFSLSESKLIGMRIIQNAFYRPEKDIPHQQWLTEKIFQSTENLPGIDLIQHVVVGFPGPIDASGNVYKTPTLWGASQQNPFSLMETCKSIWPNRLVEVINDVTACGYYYRESGFRDFCVITVSSGIGCKVFLSGEPVTGRSGRGGEIGHLRVKSGQNAPVCDCGGAGHLGGIASGRGILKHVQHNAQTDPIGFSRSILSTPCHGKPNAISNEIIIEACKAGDEWVIRHIRETCRYLANVIAAIHVAIGIEQFIITGGFALALGDLYKTILVEEAREQCWDLGQDWDEMIVLGSKPDEAGLLGAGYYAKEYIKRKAKI